MTALPEKSHNKLILEGIIFSNRFLKLKSRKIPLFILTLCTKFTKFFVMFLDIFSLTVNVIDTNTQILSVCAQIRQATALATLMLFMVFSRIGFWKFRTSAHEFNIAVCGVDPTNWSKKKIIYDYANYI